MKMVVVALVGGVVLGFITSQFLVAKIQGMGASPSTQDMLTMGVAAFLGGIWGWIGKGLIGGRPRD